MKMRLLTGWQARFHLVCLLMLLSALAAGAWPGTANAQAQVSPLPSETVAVEPLQAPVAAAPAPLPAQPLRLSADALFGFDSDVLSQAGQSAVQGVLAQVREASQVQSIQVVGYTDRIGGADYNQRLSQRRAESVRVALVQGGVPAQTISAEGRGAADPLVQCTQQNQRELIACLAPNRRVQIAGTARRD